MAFRAINIVESLFRDSEFKLVELEPNLSSESLMGSGLEIERDGMFPVLLDKFLLIL